MTEQSAKPGAPRQVGPYIIRHPLGRGSTGVTYAAVHEKTEQKVALKVVPPQRIAKDSQLATQRFTAVAKTLRKLQLPGVVRLLDAGRAQIPSVGECFYLAMEQLDGASLATALQRGPFFAPEAAAVVIQVADVVQALHEHGVIHGDLRPAVVFVTREPRVLLTEWGLLHVDGSSLVSQRGSFASSAPYLAPEQLLGAKADARSDVFALGTLLYGMLSCCLVRPISSAVDLMAAVQAGHEASRVRVIQGLEPALAKVLERALAREPGARFASARELGVALRPLAGGMPARYPDRVAAPMPRFAIPDAEQKAYFMPGLGSDPPAAGGAASQPHLAPVSAPQLDPRAVMDFILAEKPVNHTQDDETSALEAAPHMLAAMDVGPQKREHKEAIALAHDYFQRTDELVAQISELGHAAPVYVPPEPAAKAGGQLAPMVPGLDRPIRSVHIPWGWIALGTTLLVALIGTWWVTREVELVVSSAPAGAQVLVDGRIIGITPVQISARRYRDLDISVQAPGYQEARQVVSLVRVPSKELHLDLPASPASLSLTTTPPGAVLAINGVSSCRTPCTVPGLEPGREHSLALTREGCEPVATSLRLRPGEARTQSLAFKPLTLRSLSLMQIYADGQSLYLDDEQQLAQVERAEFFALAGRHKLRLGVAGTELDVQLGPASVQRQDLRRDRQISVLERTQPGHPMDPQVEAEAELVYGISLAIEGKTSEARRAFENSLRLDPRSIRARRALIALAAQQGMRDEALLQIDGYLLGAGHEVDHELLRQLGATLRGELRCSE